MEKLDPKRIENILSLTPLQEGILFHYLQNPRSELYFEQLSLEIYGLIDTQLFEKAWNIVIRANEMLRTLFRWEKLEKPSQIILKEHPCETRFHDFSHLGDCQKKTALAKVKTDDRDEGFDLTHVPFRVILCKLAETQYEMIVSNHHILYDGWSNGIILKEFFKVYHELNHSGQALSLSPFNKPRFKEFINWLQNQDRKAQEKYWKDYLTNFETLTELPIKRRTEGATKTVDYSIILDEDIKRKLDIFVKNKRVTLSSLFYTAWGILLQKYCGSEDVIFGTTVSGRSAAIKGIEDMIGLCINTIPLRVQSAPGFKLIDIISGIENTLQIGAEFENTPLPDIRSYSTVGGSDSLFDTIVVMENYPLDRRLLPEGSLLSIDSYTIVEMTNYDLSVGIMPFNKIEIKFSFKQELFEKETIENLAGHFKGIIQKIIENPETPLSQLEIISTEEKNKILHEFNYTATEYLRDKTIHRLFEEQATQTPDYIVLHGCMIAWMDGEVVRNVSLTYRQLNEQSDRLAGLLIDKGVLPGSIVGIMMERSIEMVIGIFGILKAGGAYLPIDPEYPQERIDYLLKDSNAAILLTDEKKTNCQLSIVNSQLSTSEPRASLNHSNLAYIIYTSGSTGRPKGVMIEHPSAVNLLFAMQTQYPLTPADTYLLKTSYTFDVSVTELFGWYMGGGKLAILEKHGEKDPQVILDWIYRHHITHINFVPSMFNAFLDFVNEKNKSRLRSLKYIFLAGEALPPVQVKKFRNLATGIALENIYGPTEGTVYSSHYSLSKWNGFDTVPIGKPLPNIKLYILNKYNHLQPVGIPGELYIGGEGTARGYLNRPELTAEKFIFSPNFLTSSLPNFLLYRTGDLARWLPDGNIEFRGRIDQQVKIRGFRVELSEIENLLLKHDRIKDTAVILKEDETGDKSLTAYFVSDIELLDAELREYLLKNLPDYMNPSYFVRLEKIPLTSTGKVDRGALPAPTLKEIAAFVAPRNEIENKITEIWTGILGKNVRHHRIGIDDNFFRLGGHSLKATSLASNIHKKFNVKIPLAEIFKRPTIRGLYDYIKGAVGERYVSIEPVEKKEYYILSSAQKRLYFLQQMDNAGTAYNISAAWLLEGALDRNKLENTFMRLVKRHEIFRTSFFIFAEEPVQRIHAHVAFELEYKDLATEGTESKEDTTVMNFIRAFDLSKAPLLRVRLIKIAEDKHALLVDMHHIITDGISTEILVHDFTTLYPGGELPPISPRLQYKDYAEWQSRLKQGERFLRQRAYWREEFAGEIPVLELPTDFARPAVQSFAGNTITFVIGRETVESLDSLALETGTTLYIVLLTLYNIFLAKLGRGEDIIVGTPVGGRMHPDLEKVMGVFVNTLALRNNPAGEKNFIGFLGEVKEKTLAAFENQEYQYEELVEQVVVNRDTGRNPLFDAMFVLQNMGIGELNIAGLKLVPYNLENKTSKFDLTLTGVEIEGKLEFAFEYSTKLFKPSTVERFITYFKNIVSGVLKDKTKRLSNLELMPLEEKNRILYEFNNTAADYPKDKTVHQLFVEQVGKTPGHIALGTYSQIGPITLSYNELNEQSDKLAGVLIAKGVLPDSIVAIKMERSVEMIIGIMGILKSGGAYMPIDPDYPQGRIDYMLKDSASSILLTNNEKKKTNNCQLSIVNIQLPMSDIPEPGTYHHSSFIIHHSNPFHLAYIIYTSGTTGQPKGSSIEHRNVVRLLFNDKFQFHFTDRDVWTLFHSFCFDFSVWETYGAILYGGKLVIVPKMVARDTNKFVELLDREGITVLNQTPSAFYNLINEALPPHHQEKKLYIKYIIFGGEALNPLKLKDWWKKYPQTRFINMFGITETTVHVTYKEITEMDLELNTGSIGKPIPTLSTYILDKYLKPVPFRVAGEICVGGDGVGRGYLNRVELTEEKFIKNRYKPGDRLYRSADMGRILENGDLQYLGRIDSQVKIRGFRIELGEVEKRLLNYDGIKDAVVLAEETETEKYLCAYIVSRKELTTAELRKHLAVSLPDYMIPSYFVRLKQIPLTPNGKIERKALPGVHGNEVLLTESTPPTTETEEKLAELWANILGTKPGINVDFFHSGGDSIKAVRLVNSINTQLSTHLKIADIYIDGTIKKLAYIIDRGKTGHAYTGEELRKAAAEIAILKNKVLTAPHLPEGIEDVYPMSDIQKGMVFHSLKDKAAALYHDQMVYQPVIKKFNPGIFKQAFALMVDKHSILRTAFDLDTFEEPLQLVYRQIPHDIAHDDISNMGKGDQEDYLLRFLAEDRKKVFPLDIPPLWRLRTFDLGGNNICVVLVAHHAILDGWSVASLDTELLNTYWQLLANPTFTPGILKNTYKAFITEQRVEKKRGEAADYWRNELDGYKRLELPRLPQANEKKNKVERYRYDLGKDLLFKLKEAAKDHHTTLKSLCFSAYIYTLFMHSYENELVAGYVTNNRPVCEDGDKILGCFLNTIPVRIFIPASISWLDYIKLVDRKLLELKNYEKMPLFDIVRIIGEDTQDRNPIFDVIFNFIDFHILDQIKQDYGKDNTGKLPVAENVTTNTAFDFNVSTTQGDFELLISYSDSFFDEKTVENVCRFFKGILNKFIAEPGGMTNKIELLSIEEINRLLYEFNDTAIDYPKDKTIHQLFEEQTLKTPDHVSLVGADSQTCPICITYRQLNDQSDHLAGLLIAKGVLPDDIIGIKMERSVEMIIGIMGILKSGGAYMPINPEYPHERIAYMLKDSSARILLTDHERKKTANYQISIVNCELLTDEPRAFLHRSSFITHHSNLAYIIYTSGSTGEPKGVMVTHRNVVRLVKNTNYITFLPGDSILQTGAVEFDASTFEIWGSLLNDLKLVLVNKETILTPGKLKATIRAYHISTIWMTSPLFNQVLQMDIEIFAGLKNLLVGGDKLSAPHIAQLRCQYPHLQIINGYGPTENTTFSTTFLIHRDYPANIPIGKPIANSTAYIVDKYNHLQSIGVPGELLVGGNGIARGYLNNPELTTDKFRFTRFDKTYILYRTGDLARWLPDGNIEFLGRIDHQIKIRGFRIEPGEIENRLLKHKDIKEVLLVVNEDGGGDKNLTAYIVSTQELHEIELRKHLQKELPDYMIPSYFLLLEKIPLTPNGKIDRGSLPKPELKTSDSYTAPKNEIEQKLVEIWSEVLGVELSASIGIDNNFFQLGGHSLKATILVTKIHKLFDVKIPLAQIFKTPSIRELAKCIKEKSKEFHISIEPAEEKEYYPLSPGQKRLYILQQLVADNTGYNMPYIIPLEKSITQEKLESIFKILIKRHESLRTSFITLNGVPFQKIQREIDAAFPIDYYEITEESEAIPLISSLKKPFKLDKAPLLRVNLIDVGLSRRVIFLDMHHIVMDGTSQGILEKEFRALLEGEEPQPVRFQYKDYSEWNNSALRQKAVSRQESYWVKKFFDEIPVLNLPTDYPRPSIQSIEGNAVDFRLNREETGILKRIAAQNDSTLYMLLLAVFNILLSKLCGQEDIVIGTPIAARFHIDLQEIVGMLVNTLAMRNYPSGDKSFTEFLKEVNRQTLDAYENQEYPFEELVDKITNNRDVGRNPIFDVLFNLLNQTDYQDGVAGQNKQDSFRHIAGTSKFDMNLTVVELEEGLFFTLEYSTRLFKLERIEKIIGYYKNILQVLSRDTKLKISEIEIMNHEERDAVLRLSEGKEDNYEEIKTLHRLFEEQVERTPDNIAVSGPTVGTKPLRFLANAIIQLSYRELNEMSNRLAYGLREKGIGQDSDSTVGLMVERSVEMIIGVLGILKAGGAYLPVDSELPGERKRYMLEDGEVRCLLASGDIENINDKIINRFEVIDLAWEEIYSKENSNLEYYGSGSDLVYVIYTSGSTGKPKGVMLEHRNLVNLIHYQYKYTNIDFNRVLQFTTISFDVSAQEIFSVLLFGGHLYLVDKETRADIPQLFRFIERNRIKSIFLPVSFLKAIFKEEEYINLIPRSIHHITAAGEQLVISDNTRKYLRERKVYLHNHYGPSETHVVTTLTIEPERDIMELPAIGRPVMNTGIYIVDKWRKLSPSGVAGEILIGGGQVGRGYLNRPELTSEKFGPPIAQMAQMRLIKDKRLYKTGDLARWLPDGNLEFLGRIDLQVKIRGFRIELEEIESRLLNYQGIKDAVVLLQAEDKGDKYLCAYIVSGRAYEISGLREYLAKELPGYMIPTYFVQIEKIPLTANGKVDRSALPKPGLKVGESYIEPTDDIEKKLVGLWSEILGIDPLHVSQLQTSIGIEDNFFELGGHSLKATILVSKIHKLFDVKIPLVEIFKMPRIKELAKYIKEKNKESHLTIEIEPTEAKEYYPLSFAQKSLFILSQRENIQTTYNLPCAMTIKGKLDKNRLENVFRLLTERHESLRTSFEWQKGEPVQRIHDKVHIQIDYKQATTDEVPLIVKAFIRSFNLKHAPLLRLGLIRVAEENHVILYDMHHIISDGVSMGILVTEFIKIYHENPLLPLVIQYKDFSEWQNKRFHESRQKELEHYWLSIYKGKIPVLDMPTDNPRPPIQSFAGDKSYFTIDKELTGKLKKLVSEANTTLVIGLLSIYIILLSKYSRQEDIIVGVPSAGRNHADVHGVIGYFVNTLPMRNSPVGEKRFLDFLENVNKNALDAYENHDYPFEQLVDKLNLPRDFSRNPLFDVLFVSENVGIQEIKIKGLIFSPYNFENNTTHVDLGLFIMETGDTIKMMLEYSTALYQPLTVDKMTRRYVEIVKHIVENKHIKLEDIRISTEMKDVTLDKSIEEFMGFNF